MSKVVSNVYKLSEVDRVMVVEESDGKDYMVVVQESRGVVHNVSKTLMKDLWTPVNGVAYDEPARTDPKIKYSLSKNQDETSVDSVLVAWLDASDLDLTYTSTVTFERVYYGDKGRYNLVPITV